MVIATRDQYLYPESLSSPVRSELVSKVLSSPLEASSSIQSPSHFLLRSIEYPESLSIFTRGQLKYPDSRLLALKVIIRIQSPSHCHSMLIKVSRTQSLPLEVSKSIQSPSHCHKSLV